MVKRNKVNGPRANVPLGPAYEATFDETATDWQNVLFWQNACSCAMTAVDVWSAGVPSIRCE